MRNHFLRAILLVSIVSALYYVLPVLASSGEQRNLGGMPISYSIQKEQVSAGGIKPGDSRDTVISVLGQPEYEGKGVCRYNGATIKLVDWGNGSLVVYEIEIYNDQGLSTVDGIKVGMNESALSDVYGTADEIYVESITAPKLSEERNAEIRTKRNRTLYTYYASPALNVRFLVRNGVIKRIVLAQAD